ncbi:hypothetical protein RIF29_15354 [Crotalaria pallida]|uniref:Uncharacterized protein n=1 Tax=Crotalaria pallida TaxID=3830 RepID=A0AAN9IJ32_CROPI
MGKVVMRVKAVLRVLEEGSAKATPSVRYAPFWLLGRALWGKVCFAPGRICLGLSIQATLSAQGRSRLMLSLPTICFWVFNFLSLSGGNGLKDVSYDTTHALVYSIACEDTYDIALVRMTCLMSPIPSFHCNTLLSVTISDRYRFSASSSALMGRLLSKPYRFLSSSSALVGRLLVFLLCNVLVKDLESEIGTAIVIEAAKEDAAGIHSPCTEPTTPPIHHHHHSTPLPNHNHRPSLIPNRHRPHAVPYPEPLFSPNIPNHHPPNTRRFFASGSFALNKTIVSILYSQSFFPHQFLNPSSPSLIY